MTDQELDALSAVVNYLWDDELKNFRNREDEDHIFRSVQVLNNYLEGKRPTQPRPPRDTFLQDFLP